MFRHRTPPTSSDAEHAVVSRPLHVAEAGSQIAPSVSEQAPKTTYASEARRQLDAVIAWIGRPQGRGEIVSAAPALNVERDVRVWEASGELSNRRIRIRKLLGSGLAGTVYLAEDNAGHVFIEKHYGEIPSGGSKRIGRFLTALIFTFFRQAPLSFREVPEAVITSHLANRFIVATSRAKFGRALTPPLLYTRYDEQTGGYAQAFAFVEGRPLRPWDVGLPLLGEAAVFFKAMQGWRDFLAKELGFWGLARQVDPANPNSFTNVWVTPDSHVLLLDVVPGVPGFLEARYLWWGLLRGHLPPFGDAIDFKKLKSYLERRPLQPARQWALEFSMLQEAALHWQNSEPRLWSSPLRWWHVLQNPTVRMATRYATVTHLEVKGAISAAVARDYRVALESTGKFPRLLRHTLLKMAPLRIHLALTDSKYLRHMLAQSWRLPFRLLRGTARRIGKVVTLALRAIGLAGKMVLHRDERLQACRAQVGAWIDEESGLGRLTIRQTQRLHRTLETDDEIADIVNVFALHLVIGTVGSAFGGPTGSLLLGTAIVTGNWHFALPAAIEPSLRAIAVIYAGLGRHLGLLAFSLLPTVGSMAAPLYLLRRRPELGGFMLRSFGRKAALHVPGFGERGSLCEMLGQAAAQIFIVDPAPILPPALIAVMCGVILHSIGYPYGRWIFVGAVAAYCVTVFYTLLTRQRESHGSSSYLFRHASPYDLDPLSTTPWIFGMPE